jgi:hypothetical protein
MALKAVGVFFKKYGYAITKDQYDNVQSSLARRLAIRIWTLVLQSHPCTIAPRPVIMV